MLLKLLGIADLLALIALLLAAYLPQTLVIIMALYLIIKGGFFTITGDMMSLLDVISGMYIAITVYGFSHWIVTLIITFLILQKAIISLFS